MWSKGARDGAADRILARPAAWVPGKEGERGLGVVGNQFRCLLAVERWSEGGHGGDRRRPPLEAPLRRTSGSGGPTSERGSFVGARGR
jgi:hypothetical protein